VLQNRSTQSFQKKGAPRSHSTTGFGAFAESGDPLGEGPFPLVEAFAERSPRGSSRRKSHGVQPTGDATFAESFTGSSRRTCAERRPRLSPKALFPSRRVPPLALGEGGLHRALEIWLSPKLPALGEDSVSRSAVNYKGL
jgi:hypothetical protein